MRRLAATILGVILFAGCSVGETGVPSDGPSSSAPALTPSPVTSSTTRPSPTPAPSASPSTSPATTAHEPIWSRVGDQPAFADARMAGVAAGPGGYVAVGCVSATPNASHEASTGMAWSSSTGRTWQRATLPEADQLCLEGVVASPSGYITWGYATNGTPGTAFWASSDGRSWRRAATIPSFAYEGIADVVWFRDRYLAFAGWNEPRVWSSPDGLTWSDVPRPTGCQVFNGPFLVYGDRLLTVGVPATEQGEGALGRPVVAHSVDGVCWKVSGPLVPGSVGGEWVTGGVVTGESVVLVGSGIDPCRAAGCPPPPVAAWTSNDGTTFRAATFAPTPMLGYLGPVAALAGRLVVLGTTVTEGVITPIALTSAGGTSWAVAASAPDATAEGVETPPVDCTGGPCMGYKTSVNDITAGPSAFIAVGSTPAASGTSRAVVWIADAKTATPPVQIATGVLAVTVTDGLRVRSQPRVADDSIKYEPLLAKGTLLDTLEGPVYGSGYWWYRVRPWRSTGVAGSTPVPVLRGGVTSGWVASAGRDGSPWMAVYQDVDCGPNPCPPS